MSRKAICALLLCSSGAMDWGIQSGWGLAVPGVCLAAVTRVGEIATGVSADGSVVSAYRSTATNIEALRWTLAGGTLVLGEGAASDVSRDGTHVVGERLFGGVIRAFRWTNSGGRIDLGQIPGAGSPGSVGSNAFDVSNTGVVVGLSRNATAFRGFRWTSAGGMTALGDLPGGTDFSFASAISADGQTIVGSSTGTNGDRAVRWEGTNATPIDLGLPAGLDGFTDAKGVNANGQVIVGVWGNGAENEAFRWTQAGGFQLLGDLPGGIRDSVAYGTNGSGSVVVGTGNPGDDLPDEAFYWTEAGGFRSLRDVLTSAGLDVSAWQTFNIAYDVSDDGRVIVGQGTLTDGSLAGFRAEIPAPGPITLAALALALTTPRRRR